jgi:hypothetical protein
MHKSIVGRKAPVANYSQRAQDLGAIPVTLSIISGSLAELVFAPMHSGPEYLDPSQNFCVTEIPIPEFLESGKRIFKNQTAVLTEILGSFQKFGTRFRV